MRSEWGTGGEEEENPPRDANGNPKDVVKLMEGEFKRDCVVFYNTLFPRLKEPALQRILEHERAEEDGRGRIVDFCRRVMLLKRLFLLFGLRGVISGSP